MTDKSMARVVDFVTVSSLCLHLITMGLFPGLSVAFNLEPKHAIVYTGPSGSYFGYSVGILENKDGQFVLVAAPIANNPATPNITRPGQLYKCSHGNKQTCQPIVVSNAGNTLETLLYHNKKISILNDMTNQWLGMSLDIEPTNHSHVVVCSPRWKDSYLQMRMNGDPHMTGICYMLTGDLSSTTAIPALSNLKRLVNRVNYYVEFSTGQLGFSAVFAQDNSTILFGAPGLNDWTGGVVIETTTGEADVRYIEPSMNKYSNSYAGYSIATGNFMSNDRYSIAVGAPRADNVGKVLLYSSQSNTSPLLAVTGTQIGSYFGAAVASVSMNRDKLDYLVVGAPMTKRFSPEEGRVFVFESHGLLGFKRVAELHGINEPYGRFGLTVANCGDLNKDGYQDIVVGAPFEGGGAGAIYIFNGFRQGVWPKFTSRILGNEINKDIQGFGISFSRPNDVDKNGYLDIAVGAHVSDHAVLLFSTPLIDMNSSSLEVQNVQQIHGCIVGGQMAEECNNRKLLKADVSFCLRYTSDNVEFPSTTVVKYHLTFDRNLSKVYLPTKDGPFTIADAITGKTKLRMNQSSCRNETIYIQYTDELTEDVTIHLDYNIRGQKVQLQSFNGREHQPEISNRRVSKISLVSKCENDTVCSSIIQLNTDVKIQPDNKEVFIRGKSEQILLTVLIANSTDISRSRDLRFRVDYSSSVSFIKCINSYNNRTLICDTKWSHGGVVLCWVENDSFEENQQNVSLTFAFYLTGEADSVEFDVSAASGRSVSNNVTITVPVVSVSSTAVFGEPSPEEVFFKLDKIKNDTESLQNKIAYNYIIYNSGPSKLQTSSILISYPELPNIVDMDGLNIESTSRTFSRYLCTLKKRGEIDNKMMKRIHEKQKLQLICTGGHPYCTIIMCKLNNIEAHSYVTITINMVVSIKEEELRKLPQIRLGSTGIFRNTSDEEFWDQIILFSSATERTQVLIDVYNVNFSKNVKEWRLWMIIVSAAAGIAIFLIISLVMLKVGFFRRLENEDLLLKKANWKLRIAEARHQNGSLSEIEQENLRATRTRRHQIGSANGTIPSRHVTMSHNSDNPFFSDAIDIDETHVLIPYANGSLSNSMEDISSISSDISDESGYLEPLRTRKQRVFVK